MANVNPTPTVDPIKLKTALQKAFPAADITPDVVTQVTAALHAAPQSTPGGAKDQYTYYIAEATHTRTLGISSSFVHNLPLVRFSLPLTGNFDSDPVPAIKTAIGDVLPEDRKIASVAMVLDQIDTNQTVERVDILTPTRLLGSRFGAFATYLCYAKANDAQPSWYILEGGTATGEPRVLYSSEGMNPIVNNPLGYQPTTFSKNTDYISGLLSMNGDEPNTLQIKVTDTSGQGPETDPVRSYITVDIVYQRQSSPPGNSPVSIILNAAARLGVIGHHLGVDAGAGEDIAAFFGGLELTWLIEPKPL